MFFIMFGINSCKICLLWLSCIVSLICLILNPSLLKQSQYQQQIRSRFLPSTKSSSFSTLDDWLSITSETPYAHFVTKDTSSDTMQDTTYRPPVPPWLRKYTPIKDIKAYSTSDQWDVCYKPVVRMDCPSSIQHRMMSLLDTRHRFNTKVPMILTEESLTEKNFQRLKKLKIPFGWRGLNYTEVEDFISSYNSSRSGCLLTETQPKPGCITCAVIGNGGILKGSGKGRAIDAHDYVFRTNLAVTRGFEEDVGSKTSVYVFSLHTLLGCIIKGKPIGFKHAPNDEGVTYLAFGTSSWDYTYFTSKLKSRPLPAVRTYTDKPNLHDYRQPHYFATTLNSTNVKMFHPDFMRYVGWSWVQPKRRSIYRIGAGYRPTTGAFAVVAALHSCDKVDLYGFSNHPENYTEYYFDKRFKRHRDYANHDHKTEAELWEMLDKNRIASLYQRPEKVT